MASSDQDQKLNQKIESQSQPSHGIQEPTTYSPQAIMDIYQKQKEQKKLTFAQRVGAKYYGLLITFWVFFLILILDRYFGISLIFGYYKLAYGFFIFLWLLQCGGAIQTPCCLLLNNIFTLDQALKMIQKGKEAKPVLSVGVSINAIDLNSPGSTKDIKLIAKFAYESYQDVSPELSQITNLSNVKLLGVNIFQSYQFADQETKNIIEKRKKEFCQLNNKSPNEIDIEMKEIEIPKNFLIVNNCTAPFWFSKKVFTLFNIFAIGIVYIMFLQAALSYVDYFFIFEIKRRKEILEGCPEKLEKWNHYKAL